MISAFSNHFKSQNTTKFAFVSAYYYNKIFKCVNTGVKNNVEA